MGMKALLAAAFVAGAMVVGSCGSREAGANVEFDGSPAEAARFIEYYNTIRLTPEQERIKQDALTSIPAPCCSDFSIATCCCPCNMAKSVWGLAHHLIVNRHYDAKALEEAVNDWLEASNPGGYSGDACFTGGCERAFKDNGCGGMDERHIL